MGILLIGPTRLGDAILAHGVLDWLRRAHPDLPVTIACGQPAAMAFAGARGVARVIVLRKQRFSRHWWTLWREVRSCRWRRVVDLRRSLLPWLLRAERRHTVPRPLPGEHRVALAARTLGLGPQTPRIEPGAAHRGEAARLLSGQQPVLALAPGANWICKGWPAERFKVLALRLLGPGGALAGGRLLLVGSTAEREVARPILSAIAPGRVIDGFGADIPTTAAMLERAALFVGNDSAMMHLSAAVGTPTVGLFGPTRDEHYGPWGPNGLTVRTPEPVETLLASRRPGEPDRTLMSSLAVETVLAAIAARWPHLAAHAGCAGPESASA